MGVEELKWRQLAHHHLMSQKGPHFSPHSKAKPMIKSQISGGMVSSGIYNSRSVCFSIFGENPYEEVLDYDNYYYKKIARNDGFGLALKIEFHYETKAR